MMKMVLEEDLSGTGMQHRLEVVGLEARTWVLFFFPLKSIIIEEINYVICYFRVTKYIKSTLVLYIPVYFYSFVCC